MIYFAYGSNLDWNQIRKRCPSVSFIGIAKLTGYRIGFTRLSSRRKCGAADIVSDIAGEVWGVLYKIDEIDVEKLDKSEGYKPGRNNNAYRRIEVTVFVDGDNTKPITAFTYEVVNKEFNKYKPSPDYKKQIVNGAKYLHLPEEYISKLEKVEV